jgi:hypothetical protein
MKIRAVRLSEVGCFSDAVALEDLDDGLNILAGANEAGKSTILAALRMAFEQSHKTTHRDVEALRPYGGGAPLVEVDFAIGADTWRLRKQYLTGRTAELRHLATGQISRGADAEEHLVRLLAQSAGRSSLGLLWASQKDALVPAAPDDASSLKHAISAEIAATVVGSEARHVRATVRTELEQHLTAHKPPRPKGEYDAVLKTCARLQRDLEVAVSRRDAALTRLDRLTELNAVEANLGDPERVAATANAAAKTEAALVAARDAVHKHRQAVDAVSAAESRLGLARNQRDTLAADIAALEAVSADVIVDQDASRDIAGVLADAEAAAVEARAAREATRAALASAEREHKAAVAAERHQEARQKRDELTVTQAAAEDAIAAGVGLRARLDAIRVTAELLRALRATEADLRRLEDRIAAGAPRLTIAYAEGAAGRIMHDGAPLAEGAHVVERPLRLTIAGIGTLEIAPGVSNDAAANEADLARQRDELRRMLDEAGAASVADAEDQLAARQRLEAEIGEARARLSALLPTGMTRLKADIDDLSARIAAAVDADVRPRADIELEIEALRHARRDAENADEAAQRAAAREREAAARQAAAAGERLKRLSSLEAKVPVGEARTALTVELQDAVAACERALHAAVRDMNAWRDQAPDAAQLRQLESEAVRTGEMLRTEERQREETGRTIASLEGELRADRNDEVEARVAELEGALAVATQRHGRLADEIAALQLLDSELRAEEMRSQDQYLRPITDRLGPLVDLVFPGGGVAVAENFAPSSLRRGGAHEAIAALSGGTQEQLAVMVRLAFGRLMADTGNPVPVILDDALVYSDDERILHMFRALITAARHHQLVVLTCRTRAFACLEGHRLKIVPWRESQAASRPQLAAG